METKIQILNKIKQYQKIVITRHIRPDGDCIGSSLGLRSIIKNSFPEKEVYSVGDDNVEYLNFINTEDNNCEEIYQDALLIVVDTASSDRISNKYKNIAKEIIKIDHHIPIENYGVINYVREDYPSCAAIIADFLLSFSDELKIDNLGAQALYFGIITDTGRFRYRGVNSSLMYIASELLKYNFDTEFLFTNLYIKEKQVLKLEGYVFNNFKTTSNGVSYIFFSKKVQKKYNVGYDEAASLVNCLDSIKDSLIWIAFIELPNNDIRVRLRSRFIAINELANKYHGGGHMQASGATCSNKKEMKSLIYEADKMLMEFKENNKEVF